MSEPFLLRVANHIYEHHKYTVEKLCIVLPNRRGALFLKKYLARVFDNTLWLPAIISAEDLVGELSGLKIIEETDLICHLYESYKTCYGAGAETFEGFAKWGQLILQDFNEVDRYLANPSRLYENLKDIKTIENWSLSQEELTEYQQAYLQFMNSLGPVYKHYTAFLMANRWAYQGLAYRQAVDNLGISGFGNKYHKLLFCGFNALNGAETKIIQWFYQNNKAELLWDADEYYVNNTNQEAGTFLRKNFAFFTEKPIKFIEKNFTLPKTISVISVPGQTGQAQVVKQCLLNLLQQNIEMSRVAVVLASEILLWPVLQQLPKEIEHVNITMEYPLRYSSSYSLTEILLQIQLNFVKQTKGSKTLYHKDFVALMRQPLFRAYMSAKKTEVNPYTLIQQVSQNNLSFISRKTLEQFFGNDFKFVVNYLQPAESAAEFNYSLLNLIHTLVGHYSLHKKNNQARLELEFLQAMLKPFNRLSELINKYACFNSLQTYRQLFLQVVGNASVPFIGEPLSGLQIMGVLETRTLDFDYVILVNVNEGILPSGKNIHSFIPNDLKRVFGLPLYFEKDAIYAYHFYRLLQKAKQVTITYDSETDNFGKGEKSRFITQLQMEIKKYNPAISINESIATYKELPPTTGTQINITKTAHILEPILSKACNNGKSGGLSPSGLIGFKECTLRFYFRYGAHLLETERVEESAEANTFGSILHLSLENLYHEFTGTALNIERLKTQLNTINEVVTRSFVSFFGNENPGGKNLLQQEVIKVYVRKLLSSDIRLAETLARENKHLTLLALEQEFLAPLQVLLNGKPVTIYIKGKIDRIDNRGGRVRVIDYKSAINSSDKFVFNGFENLFTDINYNKQLQLLLYAWLLYKNNFCEAEKIELCIVPFKVFSEEPTFLQNSDKTPLMLSRDFMQAFELELVKFTAEIFDTTKEFSQTFDTDLCRYCPYNIVCNIVA